MGEKNQESRIRTGKGKKDGGDELRARKVCGICLMTASKVLVVGKEKGYCLVDEEMVN